MAGSEWSRAPRLPVFEREGSGKGEGGRGLVLLGVILISLLQACTKGPAKPTGFRVGLIKPGSVADAAWNAGAYAGLNAIRDSLGVAVSHVEARTPGEQEEALRTYATEGYDLVFGHGFEFQQPA